MPALTSKALRNPVLRLSVGGGVEGLLEGLDAPQKYSMYEGRTRKPIMTMQQHHGGDEDEAENGDAGLSTPSAHDALLSTDAAADPLECQTADVVPVEPDEECPAADVVIGHEAPVAAVVAVVAVVAHHQVVARRHLAGEPR